MTSIISIYRRFPTKESCIEHLETVRWKGKPHCPYCKSERVSKHTARACIKELAEALRECAIYEGEVVEDKIRDALTKHAKTIEECK